MHSKAALREVMLKTRNSFSKEMLRRQSDMIQSRVLTMDEFIHAKSIGAYYSIGSEVNTARILSTILQDKILALPRIKDTMNFAKVNDLNDLVMGKYNIMEPREDCEVIDDLEVIIVPGVVWDRSGYRIGYGKGYYDKYLAKHKCLSIGLAYDFQVLESIPHDDNDACIDIIVTDKQIIKN